MKRTTAYQLGLEPNPSVVKFKGLVCLFAELVTSSNWIFSRKHAVISLWFGVVVEGPIIVSFARIRDLYWPKTILNEAFR
jgi:hypothetical protein